MLFNWRLTNKDVTQKKAPLAKDEMTTKISVLVIPGQMVWIKMIFTAFHSFS